MKEHSQAELLRAIAKILDGESGQMQSVLRNYSKDGEVGVGESYEDIDARCALYRISQDMRVRIKPETVMVNGVECDKPSIDGSFSLSICTGDPLTKDIQLRFNKAQQRDKMFDALTAPLKDLK